MRKESFNKKEKILFVVIGILTLVVIANQFVIFSISGRATQLVSTSPQKTQLPDVIPKGIPAIYGNELGVKYDDISASNVALANQIILKLGAYDNEINLTGNDLQRYINIAGSISCEYCCGAPSIIFTQDIGQYKAGDAACGCAHSYAMRGLAKYIIKNHPNEFTDGEILEELGKWKTLFFPEQISLKASVLRDKGVELNYINLASNKYREIEQSVSGGQVGGC